jgi:hypothetical protein
MTARFNKREYVYLSTSRTYEWFCRIWEGLDLIPVDSRTGVPDIVVTGAKISLSVAAEIIEEVVGKCFDTEF